MCLRLTSNEKKIADKDIECYKVLSSFEGIITSPFIGFHYKLGRLYETAIGEIHFGDIHEGFHSCSTIYEANIYKTLASEYIFKCIIPQGATYYEGKSMFLGYFIEGYVSDKIIIKEQIGDKIYNDISYLLTNGTRFDTDEKGYCKFSHISIVNS